LTSRPRGWASRKTRTRRSARAKGAAGATQSTRSFARNRVQSVNQSTNWQFQWRQSNSNNLLSRFSGFGRLHLQAMRYRTLGVCAAATGLVLSALWLGRSHHSAVAVTIDSTCETSPSATTVSGSTLDAATPTRSGVVYSSAGASLQLQKLGGTFGG